MTTIQDSGKKELWTRMLGQDSWDRTAGECQDGTGRTRKRAEDSQNMTEGQGS
jgi:hypothetical protein